MLEKANQLRSNTPILPTLLVGPCLNERYKEAQKYLQLAVSLLPADPIINDHYGMYCGRMVMKYRQGTIGTTFTILKKPMMN